jgi:toxin CcdB
MAQFDVYRNPYAASAARTPYLLDVQTDFLDRLDTRVVVPLMRRDAIVAAARLHPAFTVAEAELVMATADLAAVRRSALGNRVGSLADHRDEIVAALDFLFAGIRP